MIAALLLLVSGFYEQAITRVLSERFTRPDYLLIDAETGRHVLTHWHDVDKPTPVGSLWKPLLVVAKPEDREFDCKPGMCWLPQGHGRIGIIDALAHSCNAFFMRHARLAAGSVASAAKTFGLPLPPDTTPETLIGMDGAWIVSPLAMAHSYVRMVAETAEVRHGMARAAVNGTAQAIGMDVLAKTGTARCAHAGGGAGDGYVIALWPRERPKYLLMVRVHGTPGAVAAGTAGAMLKVIRDGR